MSSGVLPYDLAALFADGQGSGSAVIERDMADRDAYGGDNRPTWRTLSTVPCVIVWNRSTGGRSTNKTYVSPARKVDLAEGFVIVPSGTDVTNADRIAKIVDAAGATTIDGLFTIDAVLDQGTHVEVYIDRVALDG